MLAMVELSMEIRLKVAFGTLRKGDRALGELDFAV